jgi:hypothetical protein
MIDLRAGNCIELLRGTGLGGDDRLMKIIFLDFAGVPKIMGVACGWLSVLL